jgi:hypothetical protein
MTSTSGQILLIGKAMFSTRNLLVSIPLMILLYILTSALFEAYEYGVHAIYDPLEMMKGALKTGSGSRSKKMRSEIQQKPYLRSFDL